MIAMHIHAMIENENIDFLEARSQFFFGSNPPLQHFDFRIESSRIIRG